MTIDDLVNFTYKIDGDIVQILTSFKNVYSLTTSQDADGNEVQDLMIASWSVLAIEIKGMEDPTDYLKQAIVDANK
jgi:hypothetical protein